MNKYKVGRAQFKDFDGQQVTNLCDLLDGCDGPGHVGEGGGY